MITNGLQNLLPPSKDGIFKILLTHTDAKNFLRSIIASYTGLNVTKAEVRNNELPISNRDEKQERFDLNYVVNRGDGYESEQ